MGRLGRAARSVLLALGLLFGGLAVLGTPGCEVSDDDYYSDVDSEYAPGRRKNPNKRFAFAYIGIVILGAFFVWGICKSSKRSVVKAGEEH